ncbi:MAG: phage head closure protein [Parabacteroides sp.]|nr:phage head closure protein [Parabacteroides sp.]
MNNPKPIKIQKLNNETKEWENVGNTIHATVNKSSGSDYMSSGAEQSSASRTFTVRYHATLSEIQFNTQIYRIIYQGMIYKIEDYDDYMEKHLSIKLLGVSKGVRYTSKN